MTSLKDEQEIESILRDYKNTSSSQKATLEARMWRLISPDLERTGNRQQRRVTLKKKFESDESRYQFELRHTLLHAPVDLWKRLDAGSMTLSKARDLWLDAKRLAGASDHTAEKELIGVLSKYDRLPNQRRTNQGVTRFNNDTNKARLLGTTKQPSKNKWHHLREAVGAIVSERTDDFDPQEKDDLFTWLDQEIKTVIYAFDGKMARLREQAKTGAGVSRKEVIWACKTLLMDYPRPGNPVNKALAKRQYHKMSRLYHPDTGAGNANPGLFDDIVKAYQIIEAYNAEFSTKKGKKNDK